MASTNNNHIVVITMSDRLPYAVLCPALDHFPMQKDGKMASRRSSVISPVMRPRAVAAERNSLATIQESVQDPSNPASSPCNVASSAPVTRSSDNGAVLRVGLYNSCGKLIKKLINTIIISKRHQKCIFRWCSSGTAICFIHHQKMFFPALPKSHNPVVSYHVNHRRQ